MAARTAVPARQQRSSGSMRDHKRGGGGTPSARQQRSPVPVATTNEAPNPEQARSWGFVRGGRGFEPTVELPHTRFEACSLAARTRHRRQRYRGAAAASRSGLVEVQHAGVQGRSLLHSSPYRQAGRPQGRSPPIASAPRVEEVQNAVLTEQAVQVQLGLGGDEVVEPQLLRRELRPLGQREVVCSG